MIGAAIVVVGSINADQVVTLPRLPEAGATLLADSVSSYPGGKGANQAVAAARLGETVALVGCVGADEPGARQLDALRQAGVDVAAVRTHDGGPTGLAFVMVGATGENCIVVAAGANAELGPADVQRSADLLARAQVAVVQCEVPVSVLVETARLCDLGATRLVVNCAPATELPAAVLTRADPLVVNQSEAAQLLSRSAPVPAAEAEPAARSLLALGCRSVVITLGADGAVVAQRAGVAVRLGSPVVEVVDTTGAGDAFVAALASALLHGSELDEAAAIAVEAGAIAVTRRGARAGFPSSADLNRLVSRRD